MPEEIEMFFSLFYKRISELNGDIFLKDIPFSTVKKQTEILIIDDEEFSYLDVLRKHEYNLTQKNDLGDLRDAEAYSIILCDIMGVGNFLGSDFGGAYLIKQLKEKYPSKTIIAYSANDYNANFQTYLDYADDVVPKGAYTLEAWTSLLDRLLRESIDPVKIWSGTRKALIEAGVPTIEVAKIESDYVKAIKKGEFESFKKIYEKKPISTTDTMISLFKVISNLLQLINRG